MSKTKQLNLKKILRNLTTMMLLMSLKIASVLAVNYHVNTDKLLPITIAEEGYTRLTIEGEPITDVFIFPDNSMQVQIHKSGYVILVPLVKKLAQEESENKLETNEVYLTVGGAEGTTQDLLLRFAGKNPKPVKLVKFNLGNDIINSEVIRKKNE